MKIRKQRQPAKQSSEQFYLPRHSQVTIYYGEDMTREQRSALIDSLKRVYGDRFNMITLVPSKWKVDSPEPRGDDDLFV